MTLLSKEQLIQMLAELSDTELQQVADYIDFLKFRALRTHSSLDETQLAALYSEFADDERVLAEQGLAKYNTNLAAEDTL